MIKKRAGAGTMKLGHFLVAVTAATSAATSVHAASQPRPAYELLISGGTIYDGSGAAPFVGDVAVKDERIVFFMANDKTNYGTLVGALDGAKAAGAFVLGMATEDLPQGAVVPGAEGGVPAPDAAPAPPAPPP